MNRINYPIVIAFLLVVVLILGIGLLFPKYKEFKSVSSLLETETKRLKFEQEYNENISYLAEEVRKRETELSKIGSMLPSEPDLPSLLNFLEKACSQSGVILKGMVPSLPVSSLAVSGAQEMHVSMVVAGSYSSFKDFLSVLEKTARIIEIENISFVSPVDKDLFDFNLKIKSYSH